MRHREQRILIACSIILAGILTFPLCGMAASTVTLTSSGNGSFLLQGIGIEKAAAIDINLVYDSTTLANPKVVEGTLISGAMIAVNPNVPGILRLAIIRTTPITGNGVLATFNFDQKSDGPGKINSLVVKLADINGSNIPVLAQIATPNDTPAAASSSASNQESAIGASPARLPGSGVLVQPLAPPSIISNVEKTVKTPENINEDESANEQTQAQDVVARKSEDKPIDKKSFTAITQESKIFTQKSVLDRFKEFKGEKTAKSLTALLERDELIGCRQYPHVAIADGISQVRMIFISTPGNKTSSDVAVMGARLVSLTRDPENTNTWIADLLPEKGANKANLAVFQGEMKMICPLTVAHGIEVDLDKSGSVTEIDFSYYLKERGTAKAPKFDLSGDGKRDYLDDYIFTLNYLAVDKKTRAAAKAK